MSIAPPSDIVMDVVNAADPASVQEAQERLKASSATLAATRLTKEGKGFEADVASLDKASGLPPASTKISSKDHSTPETYRKFEAMVLQNFIKYMLPDNTSDVYGKGLAGNVWKGMMAEQLANQVAEHGGIGIADQMAREARYGQARDSASRVEQNGHINDIAASIVDHHQLDALASLLPSAAKTKTKPDEV